LNSYWSFIDLIGCDYETEYRFLNNMLAKIAMLIEGRIHIL